MKIVGVDPGKTGAAAIIENGVLAAVYPFKGDIKRCRRIFHFGAMAYYIEHVTASPAMGVVSAFTFGTYSEAVVTAAVLTDKSVTMVRPQRWQEALGCLTGGNKNITYDKAISLFPKQHSVRMFNKATADAVLIAWYGYKCTEYSDANTQDPFKCMDT